MTWSTIRKATVKDIETLAKCAARFCQRHGIDYDGCSPELAIDCALEGEAKHLRPLWARIIKRHLGPGAEGIAYGYVGFHVD